MKQLNIIILIIILFSCSQQNSINESREYSKYVDPLIGTSSKSNAGVIPAVTMPFGMVQFTAVTDVNKIGLSPYHYDNEKCIGFMATHQPSPWMGDYANLTFWPGFDKLKIKPTERELSFSHKDEISRPYYYSTKLINKDLVGSITTEFTASTRCGYFRFSYLNNTNPYLIFEMSRQKGLESRLVDFGEKPQKHLEYIKNKRKENFNAWVKVDKKNNEILGYNPDRQSYHLGHVLKNFKGYFVIQFKNNINKYGVWQDSLIFEDKKEIRGEHIGAFVYFNHINNVLVEMRVGTSFISIEQARENLKSEIPNWDFNKTKMVLKSEWDKRLEVIELTKATEKQKTIFYTSMYHALMFPRIFSEYGRYYSAFDDTIHNGVSYNDFSLWDTYRALHPLLLFIAPKEVLDMINSLVQMYQEGGWIPKWPNPSYTNIMIGTHADAVIADAFVKGVKGIDYNLAYEAIRKDAFSPPVNDLDSTQWLLSPWQNFKQTIKTTANPWWDRAVFFNYEGRAGLTFYDSLGYVPQDKTRESVSRTLEFAYDDFCVAQVAKGLGKTNDYNYLIKRSMNYKNIYNSKTGFMAIKSSNGKWMKDSLKLKETVGPESYLGFTEGDPYTYQFCVMQDVNGLIELMGGENQFIDKLDRVFDGGHFVHPNEPCHHYPYLYNYVGKPKKSQKIVRQYILSQYDVSPSGLKGNDDCGQMSAWYIFSSLGFYPVCPGKVEYAFGSPVFEEAKINLPNGKQFIIKTNNNSDDNCIIKNISLNGKKYNSFFINHDDIINGGEIVFDMKEVKK